MPIKRFIDRIPGGLMVVPLLLGALLNTIDQLHLPPIQAFLAAIGAHPVAYVLPDGTKLAPDAARAKGLLTPPATAPITSPADSPKPIANPPKPLYEFLRIGGFTQALFKDSARPLIALFLLCMGSQISVRIGARAAGKGAILLVVKYAAGLAVGMTAAFLAQRFLPHDPKLPFGFGLPLGLSAMTIIAAMTNSNGGMYVALMRQYGSRSDVAAVAVILLNDGPFLTLVSLGLLGEELPLVVFLSVLAPIFIAALLGNLDSNMQSFLKSGELMLIPFFAFALGANMDLGVFLKLHVLAAGLLLGGLTTFVTGFAGVLALKACRVRSTTLAWAEASTAGNAVMTPAAVLEAAKLAALPSAALYGQLLNDATAQISISTLTTAILCPVMVIAWHRYQLKRGLDGARTDDDTPSPTPPTPTPLSV